MSKLAISRAELVEDYVAKHEGFLCADVLTALNLTMGEVHEARLFFTKIKTVRVAGRKMAWYLKDTHVPRQAKNVTSGKKNDKAYTKNYYWTVAKPKRVAAANAKREAAACLPKVPRQTYHNKNRLPQIEKPPKVAKAVSLKVVSNPAKVVSGRVPMAYTGKILTEWRFPIEWRKAS